HVQDSATQHPSYRVNLKIFREWWFVWELKLNYCFQEIYCKLSKKMPFKWKRKSERVPVSPERMKLAVREVVNGSKLRTTAKTYGIDKMTLKIYVERFRRNGESESYQPNYNTSQIFNNEQEKLLGEYLLKAANMNYGLTTKETRELAYSFALANGLSPATWANTKAASRV
ncbi:hypothetical protein JTB14_020365, partial [Gonioctena quinquepunctata]